MKKVLMWMFLVIVVLLAIFGIVFRNEITTLATTKKLNDKPFYEMNYRGDYALDKILKKGVDNDQELADFATKQLLHGIPVKIKVPSLGCTTFNAITPTGDKTFARNFDLDNAPVMVVRTNSKNAYESISVVDPGLIGVKADGMNKPMGRLMTLVAPYIPLDGMNEKGLSVAVLKLQDENTNQNTGKPGINTTVAIRMILDKAKTTDEAVYLLKQYDMHSSSTATYHFQIADRRGKSVVVEYINNVVKVLPADKNYQVATNFYLSPEKYNQGNGQDRYQIATEKLEDQKGILTPEQSMDLLEATHLDTKGENGKVMATQWSAVYQQDKLRLDIATGHNYKKIYHFSVR